MIPTRPLLLPTFRKRLVRAQLPSCRSTRDAQVVASLAVCRQCDFTCYPTDERKPLSSGKYATCDADAVVDGSTNPLLTAEIIFSCLHGKRAQQEVGIWSKFSVGRMAQRRA